MDAAKLGNIFGATFGQRHDGERSGRTHVFFRHSRAYGSGDSRTQHPCPFPLDGTDKALD
jgi:hypothetical protein